MPEPIRPQPSTPTVLICIVSSLNRFDNRRDALTAADAGGRDAARLTAAAELQNERQQQARAAHAERMAERDRAAVHVHAIAIQAELLFDGEILAGERLVDLEQIDVRERQAGAL